MKSLVLSNQEAELLAKQDKMVFLRLLGEQPDNDYEFKLIYHEEDSRHKGAKFYNGQTDECHYIPLRYPSGEYDKVKEAWATICDSDGKELVITKSQAEGQTYESTGDISYPDFHWNSPVTMPDEAIRCTIKVKTTVKREDDGLWYEQLKVRKVK